MPRCRQRTAGPEHPQPPPWLQPRTMRVFSRSFLSSSLLFSCRFPKAYSLAPPPTISPLPGSGKPIVRTNNLGSRHALARRLPVTTAQKKARQLGLLSSFFSSFFSPFFFELFFFVSFFLVVVSAFASSFFSVSCAYVAPETQRKVASVRAPSSFLILPPLQSVVQM